MRPCYLNIQLDDNDDDCVDDDDDFFLQKCMVAVCQIMNISELLFPSSQINTYAHAIT